MSPRQIISCLLSSLVALTGAQSLIKHVPICGALCLSDTIAASSACAPDDNTCICSLVYTLKRNSEVCLRDKCDGTQYGQVMTGIDSFCRDVGPGASPSGTISTMDPPTGTTILDPSFSGAPSNNVSLSATEPGSTSIESSNSIPGTDSSAVTLWPPATATTTTHASVGTTIQSSFMTASEQEGTQTGTPAQSPISIAAQYRAGYAAAVGGLLAAAFFGF